MCQKSLKVRKDYKINSKKVWGLNFIQTNQNFACRVCGKLDAPIVLKTN
jgi:hypothetical protein